MDPFGDDNVAEGDAAADLNDFQAPTDNSSEGILTGLWLWWRFRDSFYQVEPTEATTAESYEPTESFEPTESYEPTYDAPQSYEPMEYSAPEVPAEIPADIPAVEEDNELTKFMAEYEEKIALKAQEQEKVAVECKAKAEQDMAQFLAERERIKEAKVQANRVYEQATLEKMVADLQNENPWERVVTLVDLETNRKQKLAALKDDKHPEPTPAKAVPAKKASDEEEDVSRMRQLFVQLKAQPLEQTRADAVAAN
ncbi:hypothetical protein BBJ28_00003351 [Nothophytophthora sp. Chile5]|nr:hypothetical protein BBJ28_00003351 [Nothophytophthora sp. Chile5]